MKRLVDSVRPILSGEVEQDQTALALPKVVASISRLPSLPITSAPGKRL